jgi:hypothetical protein
MGGPTSVAAGEAKLETLEELCAAARRGVMARLGFFVRNSSETPRTAGGISEMSFRKPMFQLPGAKAATLGWTRTRNNGSVIGALAGRPQSNAMEGIVTADIGFFSAPDLPSVGKGASTADLGSPPALIQGQLSSSGFSGLGDHTPTEQMQLGFPKPPATSQREATWVPCPFSSLPASTTGRGGAGGALGSLRVRPPGPFDKDFGEELPEKVQAPASEIHRRNV